MSGQRRFGPAIKLLLTTAPECHRQDNLRFELALCWSWFPPFLPCPRHLNLHQPQRVHGLLASSSLSSSLTLPALSPDTIESSAARTISSSLIWPLCVPLPFGSTFPKWRLRQRRAVPFFAWRHHRSLLTYVIQCTGTSFHTNLIFLSCSS